MPFRLINAPVQMIRFSRFSELEIKDLVLTPFGITSILLSRFLNLFTSFFRLLLRVIIFFDPLSVLYVIPLANDNLEAL